MRVFSYSTSVIFVAVLFLASSSNGRYAAASQRESVNSENSAIERPRPLLFMVVSDKTRITSEAGKQTVVLFGSVWRSRKNKKNRILVNGPYFDGWIEKTEVILLHQAKDYLSKRIRTEKENPHLFHAMAQYYRFLDLNSAVKWEKRAIKIDDSVSQFHLNLARCQFNLGNQIEAKRSFEKARLLRPNDPVTAYYAAIAQDGTDSLAKLPQKFPGFGWPHSEIARRIINDSFVEIAGKRVPVLWESDKLLTRCGKSIRCNPTNPFHHDIKGFIYMVRYDAKHDKQDLFNAIDLFDFGVKQNYFFSLLHQAEAYVSAAKFFNRARKAEEVKDSLERAVWYALAAIQTRPRSVEAFRLLNSLFRNPQFNLEKYLSDYSGEETQRLARFLVDCGDLEVLARGLVHIRDLDVSYEFKNEILMNHKSPTRGMNLDSKGRSAMQVLLEKGYITTFWWLNNAGASCRVRGRDGSTPLHTIAKGIGMLADERLAIISLLGGKGRFDVDVVDDSGKTAIEYAFNSDRLLVVSAISNYLDQTLDVELSDGQALSDALAVVLKTKQGKKEAERALARFVMDQMAKQLDVTETHLKKATDRLSRARHEQFTVPKGLHLRSGMGPIELGVAIQKQANEDLAQKRATTLSSLELAYDELRRSEISWGYVVISTGICFDEDADRVSYKKLENRIQRVFESRKGVTDKIKEMVRTR